MLVTHCHAKTVGPIGVMSGCIQDWQDQVGNISNVPNISGNLQMALGSHQVKNCLQKVLKSIARILASFCYSATGLFCY